MSEEPVRGRIRRAQVGAGAGAVALAAALVLGLVAFRHAQTPRPAAEGRPIGSVVMTAQLGFRCSLPVVLNFQNLGRIAMPGGAVTVDRVLAGKGAVPGSAYVNGRWLPVPRAWVSPDGRSYAYVAQTSGVPGQGSTSTLFVQDVAGGATRKLWSDAGYAAMVGWGTGGVYFRHVDTPLRGLWVVDPANPSRAHQIGPAASPADPLASFVSQVVISGDAAWAIQSTAGKPPAPDVKYIGSPPALLRVDLRTGAATAWYSAPPSTSMGILGLDAKGDPVLSLRAVPVLPLQGGVPGATPPSTIPPSPLVLPVRVVLVTGAQQATTIADGSDPTFQPSSALGDSHGVWLATPGSLWLYAGGELTKVAVVPVTLLPSPTPIPSARVIQGAPVPPQLASPAFAPFAPGVTVTLAGPCT